MSIWSDKPDRKFAPPFGAIIGSILAVIAWLVFILLYALYWSKGFDLFQNLVVAVVSLLVTGLLIGVMWLVWLRITGGPAQWWRVRSELESVLVY